MFCKFCQTDKTAEHFYVSAKTKCKDCTKAAVINHRNENLALVRAYDKLRASMPHRVAARKEYSKTEAGMQSHKAAVLRWANKHPERRRASHIVGNALRDGKLMRWPVCALPECAKKPQAHHPDYSRPLDVVWLCPEHHSQAHAIVANESQLSNVA